MTSFHSFEIFLFLADPLGRISSNVSSVDMKDPSCKNFCDQRTENGSDGDGKGNGYAYMIYV